MDNSNPSRRGRKLGQLGKATVRALAMVDAGQANPHAAALACHIDPATVYRALTRRRERAALKCTAANASGPGLEPARGQVADEPGGGTE